MEQEQEVLTGFVKESKRASFLKVICPVCGREFLTPLRKRRRKGIRIGVYEVPEHILQENGEHVKGNGFCKVKKGQRVTF